MENIMKEIFYKYTMIEVKDVDKNLLEYPIEIETLLYFVVELEEIYHLSMLAVIESLHASEFTINNLLKLVK